MPGCSIEGCKRPVRSLGMCKSHYEMARRRRSTQPHCTVDGCEKPQFAAKWCSAHYSRVRRYGDLDANHDPRQEPVCTVDECDASTYRSGRGLCKKHYLAWYREAHPNQTPPDARRIISRRHILKQYGLTLDDYDLMVIEQGGRCAVCRAGTPGRGKPNWNVDHDHETGAVRGLLCHNCNMALGMLGDNVDVAKALVGYLLAHSAAEEVVPSAR
jgi:Recombination endonuclease VII